MEITAVGSSFSAVADLFRLILVVFFVVCSPGASTDTSREDASVHSTKTLEVCTMETFNASCPSGHVVLVQRARYGRMNLGQCVRSSFGYLGCAVDVRSFVDSMCSGRRECSFSLPEPTLFATKPCPGDLTSYLEVTFDCVRVQTGSSAKASCRHVYKSDSSGGGGGGPSATTTPLVETGESGFISSVVSAETGVGSPDCPWTVRARPGQRINVTLLNFIDTAGGSRSSQRGPGAAHGGSGVGYGPHRSEVCLEVATVVEATGDRRPVMVCGGDRRESHALLSQTENIRIELHNPKMINDVGSFLLRYTVVGCADVSTSLIVDGWSRRDGGMIVVGCNFTDETWYLTCRNGHWFGEVANCSAPSGGVWRHMFRKEDAFPYGVLLMVVLGVAVGIIVGALLLCLIAKLSRRRACNVQLELGSGDCGRQDAEYQGVLAHPQTTIFNAGSTGETSTTLCHGTPSHQFQSTAYFADDWLIQDLGAGGVGPQYGHCRAAILGPPCGGGSPCRQPPSQCNSPAHGVRRVGGGIDTPRHLPNVDGGVLLPMTSTGPMTSVVTSTLRCGGRHKSLASSFSNLI